MVVQKTNVVRQVADYMRQQIASGAWTVNEKIPSEHTLVAELGVSRASIRVAIQQFIALGIMESVQGKGTFLRSNRSEFFGSSEPGSIPPEELKDFLRFRLIVEPELCYSVASTITEDTIEKLKDCYLRMQESLSDAKSFAHYDMEFHRIIAEASGNTYVLRMIDVLYNENYYQEISQIYGYYGLYDHEMLIRTFRKRNPESAKRCMQKQLEAGIDKIR